MLYFFYIIPSFNEGYDSTFFMGWEGYEILLRYPFPKSLPSGKGLAIAMLYFFYIIPSFNEGYDSTFFKGGQDMKSYYVTPSLNPFPRGRDLLSQCFISSTSYLLSTKDMTVRFSWVDRI